MMTQLPQTIDLQLRRKDGRVETLPYDFGERLVRELPRWVATSGYIGIFYLVDPATRLYEEGGFREMGE